MKRINTILFVWALFNAPAFAGGYTLLGNKEGLLLRAKGEKVAIPSEEKSEPDDSISQKNKKGLPVGKPITFEFSFKKRANRTHKNNHVERLLINEDSAASPDWIHFPTPAGISIDKVQLSGNIRFLTIYRNMQEYYPDLITADKNFSFTDYPIVNAGVGNNGSVPMLELTMSVPVSKQVSFSMGYSYAHNFAGFDAQNSTSTASSRSSMFFGGTLNTNAVSIAVDAGQVLWARMSKFTMGPTIYRDNYFDRLPWDYYRRSFERYKDYFSYSHNVGAEGFGRSPVQGVVFNVDFKKAKTGVMGVFGRTNRNVIQAYSTSHYPSLTYALRVNRGFITDAFIIKTGVNLYRRDADTDPVQGIRDRIQFGSVDFEATRKEGKISGEIGAGQVLNPLSNGETGLAVDVKGELYDNILPFIFSAEYYDIDINAISLDGSIINSNKAAKDGGFQNELNWDNMLYLNVAQEVDQIANNRNGLILKIKKSFGENFKIDLGYAMSQEKQNLYDTVTIQHRVNAFSRSRFRPWFQAGGPYGRIKSNWLRTFETLTVTDEANGIATDYRKGFNSVELLLKYKLILFAKDMYILNLSNFNSIQDHFSVVPKDVSSAFVNTFYNDLTIAYALGKNYSIVGNAGIERAVGGYRTNLSPENGKPINQTGYGFGLGIDYDFHKQANLHLRHRWMYQEDANFVLDKFRGQETYVELKVLF